MSDAYSSREPRQYVFFNKAGEPTLHIHSGTVTNVQRDGDTYTVTIRDNHT